MIYIIAITILLVLSSGFLVAGFIWGVGKRSTLLKEIVQLRTDVDNERYLKNALDNSLSKEKIEHTICKNDRAWIEKANEELEDEIKILNILVGEKQDYIELLECSLERIIKTTIPVIEKTRDDAYRELRNAREIISRLSVNEEVMGV